MTTAELEVVELEALEWEINVAGGQLALFTCVLLSCMALAAGITYVIEEVRHDPGRHPDDEEP